MIKIGKFIEEMDSMLGVKTAFVPAPQQQQQQPQQGQGGGQQDPMAQLMQQLPPEMQQQLQQLPPDQQQQALQQVMQGMGGQQQQGGDPSQQPQQGGDPAAQQGGLTAQDGSANAAGHVKAENQLDNTQVTLTVRELMDLTSGGKATSALLAVKQMASKHNSKMQQDQQKMQLDQQAAQQQQAMGQQGMQGGGIYAAAPDMSGKAPQQ